MVMTLNKLVELHETDTREIFLNCIAFRVKYYFCHNMLKIVKRFTTKFVPPCQLPNPSPPAFKKTCSITFQSHFSTIEKGADIKLLYV